MLFFLILKTPILAPAEAGQAFPQGGWNKTSRLGGIRKGVKFKRQKLIYHQNNKLNMDITIYTLK
jgi:hypothetical protein